MSDRLTALGGIGSGCSMPWALSFLLTPDGRLTGSMRRRLRTMYNASRAASASPTNTATTMPAIAPPERPPPPVLVGFPAVAELVEAWGCLGEIAARPNLWGSCLVTWQSIRAQERSLLTSQRRCT